MVKVIVRTEVEARLSSVCTEMKNMIKRLEAQIKIDKRTLDQQRAALKKLESRPKPDPVQIKAMKQSISAAEDRLKKDEGNLSEIKDVFSENCSS